MSTSEINSVDRMLLLGAKSNDLVAVKQAISDGADLYYRNGDAVNFGIRTGNPEMLKAFLDSGFDTDYNDEIVFHWVVKNGNLQMFELLCQKSIPPVWVSGAVLAKGDQAMIDLFNEKTGLALAK